MKRIYTTLFGTALVAGLSSCQSLDYWREHHFVVPKNPFERAAPQAGERPERIPVAGARIGMSAQEQAEEAILIAEQGLDGIEHMAGELERHSWPASVQRRIADWVVELRAYAEDTRADLERLKREGGAH